MQNYPENNRFRQYRFVKIHHDNYEHLVREAEKQFNLNLIKVCEAYILKED